MVIMFLRHINKIDVGERIINNREIILNNNTRIINNSEIKLNNNTNI